jgi:hypothetical protein
MAAAPGKAREEGLEHRVVLLEVGRQLPESRAQGDPQLVDPVEEALHRVLDADEALEVRDEPAAFDGVAKPRRSALAPAAYGRLRGEPVEAVVDLDRREALRVVVQPAGASEPTRVEPAAPVVVRPAARTDSDSYLRDVSLPFERGRSTWRRSLEVSGMQIGEPKREIVVEPIEDPVPREVPPEPDEPATVPEEPEEVPA